MPVTAVKRNSSVLKSQLLGNINKFTYIFLFQIESCPVSVGSYCDTGWIYSLDSIFLLHVCFIRLFHRLLVLLKLIIFSHHVSDSSGPLNSLPT